MNKASELHSLLMNLPRLLPGKKGDVDLEVRGLLSIAKRKYVISHHP
jgi:hypothetical protein